MTTALATEAHGLQHPLVSGLWHCPFGFFLSVCFRSSLFSSRSRKVCPKTKLSQALCEVFRRMAPQQRMRAQRRTTLFLGTMHVLVPVQSALPFCSKVFFPLLGPAFPLRPLSSPPVRGFSTIGHSCNPRFVAPASCKSTCNMRRGTWDPPTWMKSHDLARARAEP